MSKSNKKSSREWGLEIAAICGKHFFGLEDLHYGYWEYGQAVSLNNLRVAQEQYTEFLLSNIPSDVRSILDVGCGQGHVAKRLTEAGYDVDCVSPSHFLSEKVRALLGESHTVYECTYEQLDTEARYDMVMFNESFQYISIAAALNQSVRFLKNNGYLFICDVFKRTSGGDGVMGGGHKIWRFEEHIEQLPFVPVEDIDITDQAAPTMDLLDDGLKHVAKPAMDSSIEFLKGRYPVLMKFLFWKYRRKMEKFDRKYFTEGRSGEDWKHYKTYRLLVFRKQLAPAATESDASPIEVQSTRSGAGGRAEKEKIQR
jgi:SAM-dependent methyltransferase